jgi:hypothetical protein
VYATHGNSACKAAETFRLRNRISYQGMVSGFRIHRTGCAGEPNGIRIIPRSFLRGLVAFFELTLSK